MVTLIPAYIHSYQPTSCLPALWWPSFLIFNYPLVFRRKIRPPWGGGGGGGFPPLSFPVGFFNPSGRGIPLPSYAYVSLLFWCRKYLSRYTEEVILRSGHQKQEEDEPLIAKTSSERQQICDDVVKVKKSSFTSSRELQCLEVFNCSEGLPFTFLGQTYHSSPNQQQVNVHDSC